MKFAVLRLPHTFSTTDYMYLCGHGSLFSSASMFVLYLLVRLFCMFHLQILQYLCFEYLVSISRLIYFF